jgi:hypothetical protein
MRFTTFSCGTYTYDGPIKIFIHNFSIHNLSPQRAVSPFLAHTCFNYIDLNIDLRPNCQCPDVFTSTLADNADNSNKKCNYSLQKLNTLFGAQTYNSQ